MAEDVLLLHPPSFYDPTISLPRFPGPIAQTVADSTTQFIVYPIGLLSIAEFLVRNGFKASVDNIGERFVIDPQFDLDKHIAELHARVYGIDLHWCIHIPGALTLARLIKRASPESFVVLGGLTSTFYSKEILLEHSYVDGVLSGEAEEPMVDLLEAIENHRQLGAVPNLTYREGSAITSNDMMTPTTDLDSYDFTRLDLVEPGKAGVFKRSSVPICRGCVFNCATCGGSQYSYSKLFKREKPAFRSPEKIAEDLMRLKEQGVRVAFLFQDAQMAGKKYCERLVEAIKKPAEEFDAIALEFFSIPPAEYLEQLSKLSSKTTFTISPEVWNQARAHHGRNYSDDQLLKLSSSCQKLGLRLTAFFMSGIVGMQQSSHENTVLWDELSSSGTRIALGSMILMDPGSLAFDDPSRFGYERKYHDT